MGHLYHGYVSHNQRVCPIGMALLRTNVNHQPIVTVWGWDLLPIFHTLQTFLFKAGK